MQSPEPSVKEWLTTFTTEQLQTDLVAELAGRLNEGITASVPELQDPELRRELDASTLAQLRGFLTSLTGGSRVVEPPPEAHDLARTLARRGLPLRVLLRTYRAGQRVGNEYLLDRIAEENLPPSMERELTRLLVERAGELLGVSVEVLTDSYSDEREIGLRSTLNQRGDTVRAILAGDSVDPDLASQRLGYRLGGRHLACTLWTDDNIGGHDITGILDRRARSMAKAIDSSRVLTVPSGARGLWAWIAVTANTRLDALRELNSNTDEVAVRVALGSPGTAIEGFRRSHREALAARQFAWRTNSSETAINYLDIELFHLMGSDADGLRAMISRELNGLTGGDPSTTRLRETLAAYLDHRQSTHEAARALRVHRNTVRYRIQQVEELLGHRIDERRLQLEIALACFAAHHPAGPSELSATQM